MAQEGASFGFLGFVLDQDIISGMAPVSASLFAPAGQFLRRVPAS
jgi:hypothetical protein